MFELLTKPGRVLDFDIENRPLSYWYDGNCTAEITAIAWSWVGEDKVHCRSLGEDSPSTILIDFLDAFDAADVVTGHYIRKHDLPIINAALVEEGLEHLGPKLTSDTKLDLIRFTNLSASQEALAAMFDIPQAKVHMTQDDWREANRLTEAGIAKTKKRVIDDVIQHKALRQALIEYEALKAPSVWRP